MKKVYLVRHGKRESHHEETLLSQMGVKQAEATGKYFKDKEIKNLYASPLPRTQQTAKIISEILNLEIKTDDRLKERMVWGGKEGESFDDFVREWDKASRNRDYRSRDRDSAIMSGKRLKSVIEEIPNSKNTLIIAHSGIIVDYLINVFPSEDLPFKKYPPNDLYHVEIKECAITEIQIDNNKLTLLRVNDVSHLSDTGE